ncbi:hypothetical protein SEA_CONLEY_68 [Gordonia phage Conley]|nr:hypothetical protein SEA_CONLEY_68 [Gordonia phage Conley]
MTAALVESLTNAIVLPKPEKPSVVTFKQIEPGAEKDTFTHYWELETADGEIIADSSFYFESKVLAMENCVEVLGVGLSLGHHNVKGRVEKKLLAKELEKRAA